MFRLEVVQEKARAGLLKTAHGAVKTPVLMPVVTKATPKYITVQQLKEMKAQAIIANAFLLSLRPGTGLVKESGGMHKFMNFDKTIFTDCGGFQMLRKSFSAKSLSDGVAFRNPFDESKVMITPEKIVSIQEELGSDVAMALDDVPEYGVSFEAAKQALKNTNSWADRCIRAHTSKKQLLFGIAHGGFHRELRIESMKDIAKKEFDGIALGGLCIGEPKELMREMISCSIPFAPEEKPRYIMGLGSPEDLLDAISLGVDVFDSAFPTQNARHGTLFTGRGKLRICSRQFREDKAAVDEECSCELCRSHSRAYLHHLFRVEEPTALMLASYHNICYLQNLMKQAREEIKSGDFERFREMVKAKYKE